VEENLAITVLVELLKHLLGLFLCDEETATLEDTHQLMCLDSAIWVLVQTVKGLNDIEVGVCLQALANSLCRWLNLEMHTPHIAVLDLSIREEAVITSVQMVAMIRWTTFQHMGIVLIEANEGCTKLAEVESVIFIGIVALEEQGDLISSWEYTDWGETLSQISLTNRPISEVVEDHKCIVQVEIGLHGQCNLAILEFFFLCTEIFDCLDEGSLLMWVQHRF
jgi:hypothetical protein